jgi:hypothetical protein
MAKRKSLPKPPVEATPPVEPPEVTARRVEEVYRLRLGGAELPDVIEHAASAEQNWQATPGQIAEYVRQADALIVEREPKDPKYLKARHLLQRRQLYAHAMGAGDFRMALSILRDEAQLEGLYQPPPKQLAEVSDEQLLLRIAELRTRIARLLGGTPEAATGAAVQPIEEKQVVGLPEPQAADGGGQPPAQRGGA